MSALAQWLYAAMLAWAPISSHAYVEAPAITEARDLAIANDIASVALDPAESPIVPGADGRARTAVVLLSIASFESGGFRGDVASCKALGDSGRAAGLWQSHRSRERVCSSTREAARVALEQVRESLTACLGTDAPPLAAYVSGSCGRGWLAAKRRWNRATEWILLHPLSSGAGPTSLAGAP